MRLSKLGGDFSVKSSAGKERAGIALSVYQQRHELDDGGALEVRFSTSSAQVWLPTKLLRQRFRAQLHGLVVVKHADNLRLMKLIVRLFLLRAGIQQCRSYPNTRQGRTMRGIGTCFNGLYLISPRSYCSIHGYFNLNPFHP